MRADYFWEAVLALIALPLLAHWLCGWTAFRRSRAEEPVYAQDGTNQLYWYKEDWNRGGHRVARQDWWAEVVEVKPGQFQRIGPWFKYNVGYHDPKTGKAPHPWCYPFRVATSADILANQERTQEYWQGLPAARLLRRVSAT